MPKDRSEKMYEASKRSGKLIGQTLPLEDNYEPKKVIVK